MKETIKGFSNSNGVPTAEKILTAGTTVYYSDHANNGDPANADGNVLIGAKIDTASLTVTVACALLLGANVGYGPYHNVLDESDTRVATFDSTKVFQASLFNQTWFNGNHSGCKFRFIVTGSISGGEIITCDLQLS